MNLIFIAILSAAITASSDLSSLTSLDVERVFSGELWRLLSGHLSHLTWRQYALDVSGFILLYHAYGRKAGPGAALRLFLFASLFVSAAVILAGSHQVYGGLSGLCCAALSAVLLESILERPRQAAAYIAGFAFCLYLLFMGGSASGVNLAGEAHAGGAAAGLIFASAHHCLRKTYPSLMDFPAVRLSHDN